MKKIALSLLVLAALWTGPQAAAERFSPWDAWRQGYTLCEKAQQCRDRGDYVEALAAFKGALRAYQQVRAARPDWNQNIIGKRITECKEAIGELEKLVDKKRPERRIAIPESVREAAKDLKDVDPDDDDDGKAAAAAAAAAQELRNTKEELARYKKRLLDTVVEINSLRRQLEQAKSESGEVANLLRERRQLQEKYDLLEKRCAALEKKASQPDEQKAALRSQLIEEKLNTEMAQKRLSLAEKQLAKAESSLNDWKQRDFAAKKEIRAKEDEIVRLQREIEQQRQYQAGASAREAELKKTLAENEQSLKSAIARELELKRESQQLRGRLDEALRNGGDSAKLSSSLQEDNRTLQKKITEMTSELASVRAEVAARTDDSRKLRLEIVRLKETMQRMDGARTNAERDLFHAKKDMENAQNEQKLLEVEVKNLRARTRELESALQDWNSRYSKLEKRYESRTSASSRTIDEELKKNRKLGEQNSALLSELAGSKAEVDRVRAEKERIGKEARAIQKLLDDKRAEVAALEKNLSGHVQNETRLQTQNNTLARDLDRLKANQKALQTELAALRKSAGENAELRRKVSLLAGLEDEIASLKKRLAAEQSRSDESAAKSAALSAKNNTLVSTVAELKKINQKLAGENKTLAAEKDQLAKNAAVAETLEKRNAELQQSLSSEKKRSSELAAESGRRSGEIAELKKQLEGIPQRDREIQSLNVKLKHAEKSAADAAVNASRARGEVAELQKQLEVIPELENKFNALKKQLAATLSSDSAAQKQASENLKRSLSQENEIKDLQKRLTALQNDSSRKGVETGRLRGELAELQKQLAGAAETEKKLAAIKAELQKERSSLQSSRAENSRIAGELSALKKHLAADSSSKENSAGEIVSLQKQLALERAGKKQLSTELASAKKQLAELQSSNADVSGEINALKSRIALADSRNRQLAAELARKPKDSRPTASAVSERSPAFPVSTSPTAAPGKLGIAELLKAGADAEREEAAELAIWNYRSVLAIDPGHAEANRRLGHILLQQGECAEAAACLAKAFAARPDAAMLGDLAEALLSEKRAGSVLALFQKSPLARSSARLMTLEAMAQMEGGDKNAAEKLLQKAVAIEAEYAPAWRELARLTLHNPNRRANDGAPYYERSRKLGGGADAELEKAFGKYLDEKREMTDFMLKAAYEAEAGGDWKSTVWYYRKLNSNEYAADLAFALIMTKQYAAAEKELMHAKPSPVAELVRALLSLRTGKTAVARNCAVACRRMTRNTPVDLSEKEALRKELDKEIGKLKDKTVFRKLWE